MTDSGVKGPIRAVLIDLSGTLHIEDQIIGGSLDALRRLREASVNIRFITNTTKEGTRSLKERLRCLGIEIGEGEYFGSLTAARRYLIEHQLRPHLMIDSKAMEDFEGISTEDPDCVVVGLAPEHFDFAPMNKAFRLLYDGASLIAVHKARYYMTGSGGLALGPGPFVEVLECAADVTATVVGKPERRFFLDALTDLNIPPEHTVMIGDDVKDDVDGAQKVGMTGILVRTGKYRPGDEHKIDRPPDHVCEDFSEAVDIIIDIVTKQSNVEDAPPP